MPSTQLNIKLGSNNSIYTHDVPAKVRRSRFDLSRKRNFTLDAGMIVPVDLIETVPGDSFEIGVNYLIKTNPLIVAPFTNYKVRTHWYYCRLVDLWKGAETFVTKGRSGAIELEIPKITVSGSASIETTCEINTSTVYPFSPASLSAYLGIPFIQYLTDLSELDINVFGKAPFYPAYNDDMSLSAQGKFPKDGVNALPFFMYQKIYRMSYVVPNLLQENKIWFPDDISDGWRISYDKSNLNNPPASGGNRVENWAFTPLGTYHPDDPASTSEPSAYFSPTVTDDVVNILELRYALFEDDRFTTALPWAQRGLAPTIDFGVAGSASLSDVDLSLTVPSSGVYLGDTESSLSVVLGEVPDSGRLLTGLRLSDSGTGDYGSIRSGSLVGTSYPSGTSLSLKTSAQNLSVASSGSASVTGLSGSFTLNQFRELVALSVWQERNARTQGGYNETIFAHFNSSPKHQDYEPIYIGGTSDIINFSDVVQTSESSTTPQGTQTGLGGTMASGNVGFFRAPDYGYIMGLMIIQPETVYTQGVEKLFTRSIQEDFYMPEFEGLGLEEILNQEIYTSGTDTDNGLFGYQERNTEYKSRHNQDIGFFALQQDKMFSAMSQSRVFSSLPALSHQFLVMSPENMRRDFASVPSYPIFKCSFASNIKAVRPMSYKNVPETFGF